MSLDSCLMSSNVYFRETKEKLTKEGGDYAAPGSMCPPLFPFVPFTRPQPPELYGSNGCADLILLASCM